MDRQTKFRYMAYLNEIRTFQNNVSVLWQKRIFSVFNNCFEKDAPRNETLIRQYLAVEGGYKIPKKEWGRMFPQLVSFFSEKTQNYNGFIYLRGYDYYASDKSMHLSDTKLSNTHSFTALYTRLVQYCDCADIMALLYDTKLDWINYLGIQGFLEWIWNDFACLSWILISCQSDVLISAFDSLVDKLAHIIVQSVYGVLGQKLVFEHDLNTQLKDILRSPILIDVMTYEQGQLQSKQYIFRSLREGDQLWLLLACYEYKLLPWLKESGYPDDVTLIGNAFGAINSAFILKNCLALNNCFVTAKNIYCSVHEEEMHRHTLYQSFYGLENNDSQCEYALVVDDSLFTGKTFKRIRLKLLHKFKHIYCLPLTFDVSTIFNHPEEMNVECTENDSINYVEELIRTIGNNLAPARSYWAYHKKTPRSTDGIIQEYNAKICGSDLLIRILWRRFKEEIIR